MNEEQKIAAAVRNYMVIIRYQNHIVTAVYEQDKLTELIVDEEADRLLGSIYVGKVDHIVKNIDTAFVTLHEHLSGAYSLQENTCHFFMNQKSTEKLVQGDEILVQVEREAMKGKPLSLTSAISLSGRYLVLKAHMHERCALSSKITDRCERQRLRELVEPLACEEYGFIVRTQAEGAAQETLQAEADALTGQFEEILHKARFCVCRTQIRMGMPSYLKYLQGHPEIEKVTTDLVEVFEELQTSMKTIAPDTPLIFYQDADWPLARVKNLPEQIKKALMPKVWLPSGGFLMIQQTEAMVVIDVNSGRYMGKKNAEETYYKINLEAAREIARQLRIRNLSGIIIIDFIDMKDPLHQRQLYETFGRFLQSDSVRSVLVDMTKLNLVEMTRKKERRPLSEVLTVQDGLHT